MERTRKVNPACANASNPFHQCAEYCSPRAAGGEPRSPAPRSAQNEMRPKEEEEEERGASSRRKVDPLCVNASNPFHQCAEYCSPRAAGGDPGSPALRSAQNGVRSKEEEEEEGSGSSRRKVDPLCVNASNPFHQCAEYCSPRAAGGEPRTSALRSAQNGVRSKEEGSGSCRRKVDPLCVNASNPFHQCAEYCSPRTPGAGSEDGGGKRSVGNGVHIVKNGKVDPMCVNASNPFHVCAEYCSQKRNENSHINGAKSGSSTPHGSKRSFKLVQRDDANPNCVNASNPFHKCADYCVQKMNGTV